MQSTIISHAAYARLLGTSLDIIARLYLRWSDARPVTRGTGGCSMLGVGSLWSISGQI